MRKGSVAIPVKTEGAAFGLLNDAKEEFFKFFLQDPGIKRAFIKILLDRGVSQLKIARTLKIDRATIKRLEVSRLDDDADQEALYQVLKDTQANKHREVAWRALNFITDAKLKSSSAAQLSMISGLHTDKALLLEGKTPANVSVLIANIQNSFNQQAGSIDKKLQRLQEVKVIEAQ